jgi:hypothetical protein
LSSPPPVTVDWQPTLADRLAEVDHLDAQRRPWRAAIVALAALAVGTAAIPRPIGPVGVAVVVASAVLAAIAAWRMPLIRGGRGLPEEAGRASIEADESRVTLRRDGLERALAPAAIRELAVGADHVFLHLLGGEVVTVPCRVFPKGALDRFVLTVERFRKRGSAPPEVREPGFDRWRLEYRLHPRHLAPASVRAGDLERIGLLAVAAVSVVVVVAVADPWGDLDRVLLALVAGIAAVLVAGTSRQAWVAVGRVQAAFGSAGGRIQGRAGVLRFGWDEVGEVQDGPTGVAFRLRDRVLWVPGPAFRSSEDQARFAGDVEDWWRLAHPAPESVPTEAPPAATGTEDPFAPPRT